MPHLSDLAGEEGHGARDPDRNIRARRHGQVLSRPNTAGSLNGLAKVVRRGVRDPALNMLVLRHDQPDQVLGQEPTLEVPPEARHRAWGQGNRRSASKRDQVFSVPDPGEKLKG